ncbi:MAG: helix-turn-helix domain-containing protein [Sedimentisphaeraceae bacterium JB056]
MSKTNENINLTSNFSIPTIYPAGRRLENTSVRDHAHDFTEIILVTQGECLLKIDNRNEVYKAEKNILVTVGDLIVIPPHLSHTQIEKGYVGTSYIGFRHKPEVFDSSFRVISLKNEIYITRWIDDIIDLHTIVQDSLKYSEVAAGLLQAITTRLKQIEYEQKVAVMIHPLVQKSIELIHSNLTDVVSVDQIAEQVDLSTSYLTKLFKKSVGLGPIQYQQQQRMQLACRYLRNPYITVKEVAQKCGYENVNFFIRLFKKNYKKSPGKWREKFFDKTI